MAEEFTCEIMVGIGGIQQGCHDNRRDKCKC